MNQKKCYSGASFLYNKILEIIILFKYNKYGSDRMLNKNGWGIKVAIAFCGVFVLCLLVVVVIVSTSANKLESRDNNLETDYYPEDNTDYYDDLENDIYEATKEYIEDNPKIIEKKDYFKLNIDTLLKNGYITNFSDEESNECKGYVDIYNAEELSYSVYINCPYYQTTGYDEGKEF